MTDISKSARAYLRSIAAKGGAAGRGESKARSSALARAAVHARWARWYALTPEEQAEKRKVWREAAKKRAAKRKANA